MSTSTRPYYAYPLMIRCYEHYSGFLFDSLKINSEEKVGRTDRAAGPIFGTSFWINRLKTRKKSKTAGDDEMTPFKITTQVTHTTAPTPTAPTQVRCAQIPRQHARSRPQRLTPAPRALPAPRRRARHRAKGACRVAEKAQLASSAKSKFFCAQGASPKARHGVRRRHPQPLAAGPP